MKVVILCGGQGTRLREETEYKPKPMVEIGGYPILWHIMKIYSHFGFNDFILCLGYKGWLIKEYFLNYRAMQNDFTLKLGQDKHSTFYEEIDLSEDWQITFAETGPNSMTGCRIKKIQKYIEEDSFMLTYGDGVSDINIQKLLDFHLQNQAVATVTGVQPSSQFGHLKVEGKYIKAFSEKPKNKDSLISGGFFVFSHQIFDYLDEDESCVLEQRPLENLAAESKLVTFKHKGFWKCMDTYRDYLQFNEMWQSGGAKWKIWE